MVLLKNIVFFAIILCISCSPKQIKKQNLIEAKKALDSFCLLYDIDAGNFRQPTIYKDSKYDYIIEYICTDKNKKIVLLLYLKSGKIVQQHSFQSRLAETNVCSTPLKQ
jgi:hypothetical protein